MTPVRFYFDFTSTYSYLAATQMDAFAARTGATILWTPVFLAAVMKATGNQPPATLAARAKYLAQDVARWAAVYNVPFRFSPYFPVASQHALRAALALQAENAAAFRPFVSAVFHATWVGGQDTGDRAVLARIAEGVGASGDLVANATDDPRWKAALRETTDDAVARGAFGVPTFVLGEDEMYFGNDRLDLLEQRLKRGAPFPTLEIAPAVTLEER